MGRNEKRDREKAVLERLLRDFPDFMDGISFRLAEDDPPDFLGESTDGQKIGLELTSWVNRFDAEDAIEREHKRVELQEILDWESYSLPKNLSSAIVTPRWGEKMAPGDHSIFCDEFHTQVSEIDGCWETLKKNDWRPIHQRRRFDYCAHDFDRYPTLRKYIVDITFFGLAEPDSSPRERSRIAFESDGGIYDPATSIQALRTTINKKVADYGKSHKREHLARYNLNKLYLLAYTEPETFGHNKPYQTAIQAMLSPFEGLERAVMEAAQDFIKAPAVFHGIFLFYPLWRESRLVSIWPTP